MDHLESYTVSSDFTQTIMSVLMLTISPQVILPLAVIAGCLWFRNGPQARAGLYSDGGQYILMMFMQVMMTTYVTNFMLAVLPFVLKPVVPGILMYSILTQLHVIR